MRLLPRSAQERTLPRVTIITLSHNDGLTIERTLCSVLDQGYGHVEHIVVDAGSDDETLPIIQHYDEDLAHWHSRKGLTPGAMINHALRIATGGIVCIVRAGDLLLPGAIEDAVREMSPSGGPRWIVGHAQRIDEYDDYVTAEASASAVAFEEFLTLDAGRLPLQASFFRRDILLQAGGFDATLTHGYGYEMACRLMSLDIRPRLLNRHVVAIRETREADTDAVLAEGQELLAIAERYADWAPMSQQYLLTQNLTERRRIYEVAAAESRTSDTRRFFWGQMLRRPEWLSSAKFRAALFNSMLEPVAKPATKPAARKLRTAA